MFAGFILCVRRTSIFHHLTLKRQLGCHRYWPVIGCIIYALFDHVRSLYFWKKQSGSPSDNEDNSTLLGSSPLTYLISHQTKRRSILLWSDSRRRTLIMIWLAPPHSYYCRTGTRTAWSSVSAWLCIGQGLVVNPSGFALLLSALWNISLLCFALICNAMVRCWWCALMGMQQ
jgi:hypothetical protein